MPELPEVECVCLDLVEQVVNQVVLRVSLRRRDIVQGGKRPSDLLYGRCLRGVIRWGKQLALIAGDTDRATGGCVCVHLGMSGSLRYYEPGESFSPDKHTHMVWHMSSGGRLAYRDPRRFGGLWTFHSKNALLEQRWSKLGPDALTITASQLLARLRGTHRVIKAALLDQSVLAGLGNIYIDELLFLCRINPTRPACEVDGDQVRSMVKQMRQLLNRAIRAGGSTLRDYVNAQGRSGEYQVSHQAYGRSGQPCVCCQGILVCATIAGRTTTYCPACQAG